MDEDFGLLSLLSPTGNGQENQPDDVEALDGALRKIDAYRPPAEYSGGPQRYATGPLIGAIERFQEQNGLKIDGYANPGGPTERAINNRILKKPRGAGLLFELPAPIRSTVGNGFKNERADVASVQRRLGALDYLPEDPFDRPHGFIDEPTTEAVKRFQTNKGLTADGWLAPRGETERALDDAVSDVAREQGRDWFAFAERAGRAQKGLLTKLGRHGDGEASDSEIAPDDENGDVTLMRGPPPTPGPAPVYPGASARTRPSFGPRGLLEVDPRYVPRSQPDFRRPAPLPPDLEWANPGPRPRPSLRGTIPRGFPDQPWNPPTIDDIRRAVGLPPQPSVEEDAERELRFPRRPASPDTNLYVPEPGSPLRIPILDVHHHGRPGDPRTVQTTTDLTDAIKEACSKVFKNDEVNFEREPERYLPRLHKQKGERRGASYVDEWMHITIRKHFTIIVGSDTYTPKVDASPNAAEQSRFLKLQVNMSGEHGIVVRVPKAWTMGQEINTEKLSEATKEICEQIKNMLDSGELDPDKKDKVRLEWLLKHLVEPRRKSKPDPKDQSDLRK